MKKANYNTTICKLYQQTNNKKHLYIYIYIIIFCCLLINKINSQDSIYKRFYFPSGTLSSEGNFVKNAPSGKWINYYANGNIKSHGFWRDSKLDSVWTFYDIKGNKTLEETYLNDYKHGKIIKYDKSGLIKMTTNYDMGNKEGKETVFFPESTKVREIIFYKKNQKNGKCFRFDKDGNIISILNYDMGLIIENEDINRKDRDGKKHGIWKEFYKNGKIKREENYFHGIIDGMVKEFNKDGGIEKINVYSDGKEEKQKINLKIKRSTLIDKNGNKMVGVVFNGKKNGLFKVFGKNNEIVNYMYYNNDTLLSEGMYDSIKRKTGIWKYYFDESKLKKTGFFKDGKKDSIWKYYYKSGIIQQKGAFKDNFPNGAWTWWYENEKIKREEVYLMGKENGEVKEMDSLGNLLTRGKYSYGQREGEWYYVINDYKEEGNYTMGMKIGIWKTTFMSTGKTKFIGEFLNGIPVGEHKHFYSNGKPRMIGKFENGEKEGEWKKYNSDGEIIITYQYKRGVEIKRDGFKVK